MALAFVIITPARNEEAIIGREIESMISQTVKPLKWVIVSDGSTDRTDEIVRGYGKENPWIELIRMPEHRDRHFAAKVQCFNAGLKAVRQRKFDIIGNLDADLTFDPGYFEYLITQFATDPALGVAGTPFVDEGSGCVYDYRFTNIEHVSGACQLFRRKCFEEIGGYQPIKGGGIDWVAVTTARMHGWKTCTFTDKRLLHHRKMGTGNARPLRAAFNLGKKDYALGNHPVWQLFRCTYQMVGNGSKFLSGAALLCGYATAAINRSPRPISNQLLAFARKEQMQRLYSKMGFRKRKASIQSNNH